MKCISLVSSGIDSPVAAYVLSSFVDSFVFVHVDNRPFTDDREITNSVQIVKKLDELVNNPVELHLVSHGPMLRQIQLLAPKRYTCVLCKRMMLRYADRFCQKESADAIIMGDSLGQVASQTLQNIKVVDQVTTLPVLRPLIGWDKEEIISLAKKIGTFDLSILPSLECQAVPNKPSTRATIAKIEEIEQNLSYEPILAKSISQTKRIDLNKFNSFKDL
ncbi:MAG: hypothetical protein QCI00_03535 [Candidatus Thermoplasmatota archaeon]|nr:hypothetical protein [Candidatus Thermoplasmatota archaeon]